MENTKERTAFIIKGGRSRLESTTDIINDKIITLLSWS